MIQQNEIRERARDHGVPVSTIERDYAQNWLLEALSSLPLVLKGGTGIRKVYIGDYRFSDDLDFTVLEAIEKDELRNRIENAVAIAGEESGINFSHDIETQENENGFEISVYFQIMQRGDSRTKIKIDITNEGNEKILLPLSVRRIIHPYSDTLEAEIRVYALEEILAEKIRSLFQRTRPRDLYDVWYLWDRVEKKKVLEILAEKFRTKNVEMDIKDFEQRRNEYKNAWERSLRRQLKALPEFEDVFSTVLGEVEKMCIEMNRDVILKGEIGALLHDIGKFHPDFVKSKSVEKTAKDKHAQIDEFLRPELIKFIRNSKFDITVGNEKSTIYNFITQHHPDKKTKNKIGNIVKLLIACDKKDSADDKGIVRKKQHLDKTYIASPFGYKKEKIDLVCLQKRFEDLEDTLIGLFKGYISGTMSLSCFRESLMKTLEVYFSHALGETRIPSNDVTLWGHSYSTASLFKSLLAAIVCGANIDFEKPQWRIFGICWDGIEFINRGKKVAEIRAREEVIDNIKKKLKKEFEDKIPIGNAIYEDTNGIYLTFPELGNKSKELAKECAEKALEIIYKESDNELWPFFTLTKASATLTLISEELEFASEKRKIPKISPTLFVKIDNKEEGEKIESNFDLKTEFDRLVDKIREKRKDTEIDICPICRIRPKDEKTERCEICENRRRGRLEQWLSNRQDTVWIDEVADKNNRVALISLNFYLDSWLDGTMIGTIYSQSFEDWYYGKKKKKENNRWVTKSTVQLLREAGIDEIVQPTKRTVYFLLDEVFKNLNNDKEKAAKILDTFFQDINITPRQLNKHWGNIKERIGSETKENLARYLFTQNPSPARLYRIWKETEEFFDLTVRKIQDEIYSNKWRRVKFTIDMDKFYWFNWNSPKKEDILSFLKNLGVIQKDEPAEIEAGEDIIKIKAGKREIKILKYKYKVKLETKGKFYEFTYNEKSGRVYRINNTTTYILKIDNLKPENLVVFHNKDGEFYTIESLEKFKFNKRTGEEAVKEALKNGFKHIALEDEPDKNLLINEVKSDEIKVDDKPEVYYPLIEINRSPLSLRLIVPASDSMKIIELATKFYNERFERVLGKLPLNVKLLVAKRKFPLYVLLDAEKRMLEGDEFKTQLAMNPWWNADGHRYEWYYSFYPTKPVEEGEKYTLDNLSSISKGKIFHLYPGYFDFDLLFGTTDRYGIYYKGKMRGGEDYKLFTGRPFYFYQISEMLELWDVLSSNLSVSQINFIEEMLISKLMGWRNVEDAGKCGVFMQFAEATLKNAFDRKWKDLREETKFSLVNSAINGILLDTIILFRHVIKCGGEESE